MQTASEVDNEPSVWTFVFSAEFVFKLVILAFFLLVVIGMCEWSIDNAFVEYSFPALQQKIEASETHGWQFLLSDGYKVTAPYATWKAHKPGDRIYVERHRSFISQKDVLMDGN